MAIVEDEFFSFYFCRAVSLSKLVFYYVPFYFFCRTTGRIKDEGTVWGDLKEFKSLVQEVWKDGEIK